MELRSPDPARNPYLAVAVMLAAGLDGIERKPEIPADVTEDVYEMTPDERAARGIGQLPESLNDAINELEKSHLVCDALGAGRRMAHPQQAARVVPVPHSREPLGDPRVLGLALAAAPFSTRAATLLAPGGR